MYLFLENFIYRVKETILLFFANIVGGISTGFARGLMFFIVIKFLFLALNLPDDFMVKLIAELTKLQR